MTIGEIVPLLDGLKHLISHRSLMGSSDGRDYVNVRVFCAKRSRWPASTVFTVDVPTCLVCIAACDVFETYESIARTIDDPVGMAFLKEWEDVGRP